MKNDIIALLEQDYEKYAHLGSLDELKAYLAVEMRECDLSTLWKDVVNREFTVENPNNILLYAVLGKAGLPTALQHHWSGGDFPDISKKKEIIIRLLKSNKELSHLGSPEQLLVYLKEEFRELDISQSWETLLTRPRTDKNPNNILLWYLLDLSPMPQTLEHIWKGGDFPDIDCLEYSTVIKTPNGDMPIGDISIGDNVYNSKNELVEVLYTQDRLSKTDEVLYEIEWDDGTKTVCSANDKFLIDNKFIAVCDLARNNFL